MGSWGTELLDNDSAFDVIGDLVAELAAAAAKADPKLDKDGAARFCARLAVILHYEPTLFDPDETNNPARADQLRGVVRDSRAMLDSIAPSAKALFDAVASRRGVGTSPPVQALLRDRRTHTALQKLVDQAVENIEDDLESQQAGAFLDVLCFVAPYVELPGKTIRHWLRRMRELASEADDADMHRAHIRAIKKLIASLEEEDQEEDDEEDDEDDDDDDE